MTTTTKTPAPWADQPYKLLATPPQNNDIHAHSAIYCATEMTHSHNCLLRGLNAIVLQAPCVPSAGQGDYNEQDVKDLLFFVESWVKMVDHHHHAEETCMFPEIEQLADEPGLLSHAQHQHEEFHDGLQSLGKYANEMQQTPKAYNWEDMKDIIDSFAPSLTKHLYEEIGEILALERLDSDGLRKCWAKAEEVAKARGKIAYLYDIFPVVLQCCDKTFEGGNDFPPLPGFMPYAIKYWFGTYHPGAWRFGPCDFWGRPKVLEMLGPVS